MVFTVRPLGDSITRGYSEDNASGTELDPFECGYRCALDYHLMQAGYFVRFIGTRAHGLFPNNAHEGWGGFIMDQITSGIAGWVAATEPADLTLLLIGTNDALNDLDATMQADFSACITAILTADPLTTILASTLPPLSGAHAAKNDAVVAFNTVALPAVVAVAQGAGYAVYSANAGGALAASDTFGGIHPTNATGYPLLARQWATYALPLLQRMGPNTIPEHGH